MRNLICVLILFSSAFSSSAIDPALKERAADVIARHGTMSQAWGPEKIAELNDQEQNILVQYYKARKDETARTDKFPDRNSGYLFYRDMLRMLGDPGKLQRTVEDIKQFDPGLPPFQQGVRDLISAGRAESIKQLAPLMFVNEPYVVQPWHDDVPGAPPKSYIIPSVILRVIDMCPKFNPEVKKWAEENSFGVGGVPLKPMMREWWKLNQSHFERREYNLVSPGPDLKSLLRRATDADPGQREIYIRWMKSIGKNPDDPKSWEGLPPIESIERTEVPLPQRAPTGNVPPPPASSPPDETHRGWIVGGTLGLLLVFAAATRGFWARRRGS